MEDFFFFKFAPSLFTSDTSNAGANVMEYKIYKFFALNRCYVVIEAHRAGMIELVDNECEPTNVVVGQ